ncbi:ABC transporter substrate-binding protein [Moorena sp. SIO4G3]|uniref:ABC transporter substrate-binding protein n=1 Tax=Moorena sp. SIO4G3 TaxID=2607821 RepID=UPI0025F9F900|nr:ABC transporter substrate-binding protein [Moorena sp. SIO4G3]
MGILIPSVLLSQFWALPALTQHPVKLTLLMGAGEFSDWQELLVKNFELENPDIQIELIEGPLNSDLTEDLYTSAFILGDSPYDLINMDVIWAPKFAAAGWLLDLSDRVSKEYLKEFLDKAVDSGRYQRKLYRIPFRSDGGILYYRQDLLEQAGFQAPKTFEQLVNISQQLQANHDSKWGYLWQGRQYEGLSAMFVEILAGFGGFWVDPETLDVGLDQPEAIKAVEFLRSTIKQGISPPGVTTYQEEETRLLFQNGDAVFLRNWPYVWSLANQEASKVKGKIGISPMVHSPGGKAGACLGGWGLGIAKSSKHPEEAWRAIEYFTSEKAQRRYTLETGYLPTRRKLFADPDIVAKYPHYPKLLEVLEGAVLRPPVAQYSQVSDILQRYLNAVLTNPKLSPEKMMKAAADETRRLLSVE